MDILPPHELISAINKQWERGFGYGYLYNDFYESIIEWHLKHFNLSLSKSSIIYAPNVLFSIKNVINILNIQETELLFARPFYSGYTNIFDFSKVKTVDLSMEDINYQDWLIRLKETENVKAIIICNPHNPTGKILDFQILNQLVKHCKSNDIWILSDEIHMDFSYKKFIPLVSFDFDKIVSFHSIGKTFNVSGISGSYILNKSKVFQQKFQLSLKKNGLDNPDVLNLILTKVAYKECDYWLDAVKKHIYSNIIFLRSHLDKNYVFEIPDATYSAWINYSKLNITEEGLKKYLFENGMKVMLGSKFGCNGKERWFRMNLSCNRQKLMKGIQILNDIPKV